MQKHLRRLSPKKRALMLKLFKAIEKNYQSLPDVQLVKGKKNMFRVRAGDYRIFFSVHPKSQKVTILDFRRRNEKTYKNL